MDPVPAYVEGALTTAPTRLIFIPVILPGNIPHDKTEAIRHHVLCAGIAHELGLGVNAGHDLNLDNLRFYVTGVPQSG
ncbi:MAG: pyridoxine 5'-phosphate synthase [Saprospiraceae bacterium]